MYDAISGLWRRTIALSSRPGRLFQSPITLCTSVLSPRCLFLSWMNTKSSLMFMINLIQLFSLSDNGDLLVDGDDFAVNVRADLLDALIFSWRWRRWWSPWCRWSSTRHDDPGWRLCCLMLCHALTNYFVERQLHWLGFWMIISVS